MKFLIILFISLGCSMSAQQTEVDKIDNKTLIELRKNPDVQLLDVRTPKEVANGIIEGAIHIDFFDANFDIDVAKLDKKKPIIVYCAAGGRSAKSGKKLAALGFTRIYDLTGGYGTWESEGYPVTKQ